MESPLHPDVPIPLRLGVSVRAKILGMFLFTALVMGAILGLVLHGNREMDLVTRKMVAEDLVAMQLVKEMQFSLATQDDAISRYLLSGDDLWLETQQAEHYRLTAALLQVPNDPFRYSVCAALKDAADPKANQALEAIVEEPRDSLNPNVLRMRAVQALGVCGDAGSVEVIAPHAQSGAYFNGLTGVSIDALVAIAKRHRKARAAVDRRLPPMNSPNKSSNTSANEDVKSWPGPPAPLFSKAA